ncbi:hypothetical protein FBR43_14785 [Sphingomonas baiyangensis]|uniref:Phage tail collar domain-containing protein n=1 Tax=Sphingomonas baiyangensis TaxID=2572576 RepID=A0A4U1L6L8_9SPHN|nr:hypothetical protein FBR43_14785 [Sphingomonas baiyangensis]
MPTIAALAVHRPRPDAIHVRWRNDERGWRMEPFIGQWLIFAGFYAPRGWAFCNGRLMQIR